MAKLNSAEEKILEEIQQWKSFEPGFLTKATHLISRPISWAGENLIPNDVKNQLAEINEKAIQKLQDISQWSVNEADVLKATKEFEINSDTIIQLRQASIFDLDHVSKEFVKENSRLAMAEGFGTGLIGWPGLIADLPALLTLSFRTVYQVSLCYGFSQEKPEEGREAYEIGYMLRVFRTAAASSLQEKIQSLTELNDYAWNEEENIRSILASDFARKQVGKVAAIQVSKAIINQIVKQTIARKAITSIPGVGAILTAGFNYSYVRDVGDAAFMLYRERFLAEKKGRRKAVDITIS